MCWWIGTEWRPMPQCHVPASAAHSVPASFIPLVERFGQQVQEMETRLMADVTQAPDPSYIHRVRAVLRLVLRPFAAHVPRCCVQLLKLRREIRFLSRLVRPIHDVVKIVIKTDVIPLPKGTELCAPAAVRVAAAPRPHDCALPPTSYLRDVLDHVLQVMENLTAQMELCKVHARATQRSPPSSRSLTYPAVAER